MTRIECAACSRTIDAAAKVCPYCGADPSSGERGLDTQSLLQEVFRPKEVSASESVMEYARQRQGVVITISAFVAFLILGALHQFVTMRNASAVTDAPAVPLSEITDVTKKPSDVTPVAVPELDFQYDGNAAAMRTYIVEKGAVTPPDVVAAQQAAKPPQTPQQTPAQTPAQRSQTPPKTPARPAQR